MRSLMQQLQSPIKLLINCMLTFNIKIIYNPLPNNVLLITVNTFQTMVYNVNCVNVEI